ncbi:MAG TPA: carboxypeptidase regulatory-like domain-containing protein [Gemmatimonadales bacterium]|nr:carboxypeptidase regulatory-like domain-containing protein [Gemmatimonadales bacterium]
MRPLGLLLAVAAVALIAALPTRAVAQAEAGTDIITGTILGDDGNPVQDASVEAYSLETQVTRRARTDARGRFTILFPDGGGQYRMNVRVLGMNPRTALVMRDADEDRLVWNVQLESSPVTLEPVNVNGGPLLRGGEGPTPGSTERVLSPDQLARLPIDPSDLAALVSLVPGVLPISGTDSTASAFSVAGLGPSANAVTLDGLLIGNTTVPQEGLRQTRVITNTYDVSRGQFSGGLVASTTRSGSNVVQGTWTAIARNQDVALDAGDSPFTEGYTQNQLSGGIGGPLIKDRMFIFASGMARLQATPEQTLFSATATDLGRLGISADSVQRFLQILNSLGVPAYSVEPAATRANDNYSALVRFDWVLSNSQTITLRGNWNGTSQNPARLGALALPQVGGDLTTSGGGLMATLTSHFGSTVLNEARGFYQAANNDGNPFSLVPQGRVQVASDLPDSTVGVTTLVFGGNAGLPSSTVSSSFEASDEVSWLPGAGSHRFKVGGTWLSERTDNLIGGNEYGTYTYNSLAELASDSAATFRRTLGIVERRSYDQQWGAYAGDVWVVTRPFQLTYGLRLEGTSFGDPPAYNPAVDSAFHLRTDHLPSETHLSPRAGFTWTFGSAPATEFQAFQPATWVIRGGVGEFRNQAPTNLVAQARASTGLGLTTSQVACVGGDVPAPDWPQVFATADSIPGACLSGGLPQPLGSQAAPAVEVLAPGFETPRAWRGSLSVERRLTQLLRLSVEGSLARGVAQTGITDVNLNTVPVFTLASEGNRPVYVPASAIVPSTGAAIFTASRVDPAFGNVLLAQSNLYSSSAQITTTLGGVVGPGIVFSASYTLQRARDQQTGIRSVTAGDPDVAEWARSSFERQHNIVLTVTYPFSTSLEITSVGRLTSGVPFTPTVGGDVNGDGLRNDAAFIFAPGSGTPVAQAMSQLLATASPSVRGCLERQIGTIAARNSCIGPWQGTVDFQFNWRPAFWGLNHRLQVSVVTYNFLRGLDELLHGVNGAQGWGLQTQPDATLLYVTGFDPATMSYAYQVNERFGATYGSATAYRPPFQIGIQARLTIGPDRVRQALDAMRAGGARGGAGFGGGGFGGGGFGAGGGFRPQLSVAALVARIDSALPNPAGVALDLRDSLQLDSGQIVLLTPIRDSLAARNATRVDSLRHVLQRLGDSPAPNQLIAIMPQMRPLFQSARDDVARAIVDVHAVLREEQWQRLPASVREFQSTLFRRFQRPGPGPQ